MPRLQIVIVSTRQGRKGPAVAAWFEQQARAHGAFDVEVVDLATVALPLMDEPEHPRLGKYQHAHTLAWSEIVTRGDAYVFVTPEYNRSIPGGLKNAIDWASRPYGKNAFTRKPSAVIGASPGKIGTAVGQQHLRSILAFCNSPLMNSIEAYIHFEPGLITEDGAVTNPSTEEFLRNYMAEFQGFIQRVYTVLPRNE